MLATVGFLCPDGDHKKYASVAGLSALERGGSYKYVHQVPREAKPRVLTLRKVFDMLEME